MSSCAPRAGGGVRCNTLHGTRRQRVGSWLGVRGYKSGGLLNLSYGVSTCGVDHQTLPYLYN